MSVDRAGLPGAQPKRSAMSATLTVLSTASWISCLIAAGYAAILAIAKRPLDRRGQLLAALAGAVILVFGVAAAVALATGAISSAEPLTLVAYLLTAWSLPVGAVVLGRAEETRWGSIAAVVALLGAAVMVVRCTQLWVLA